MTRLIVRRLLLAIPLLIVVSMLTFVLTAVAPGNPAAAVLGPEASAKEVDALSHEMGLDEPLPNQYMTWAGHAVTGDLGESLVSSESVGEALSSRLPVTLSLVIGSTAISLLFGVALGMFSALRGGSVGLLTDVLAMLGWAIPSFWLGLMLIDLVAVNLHWLPATGYVKFGESPLDWARSLILPWVTLAALGITGIAKQTRDSMREVMGREFIASLRGGGVPEWRIVLLHGLRNAAIPIVTVTGVFAIAMLGGAVLVETVFAMPGLGALAVTSARAGDLTMLQGIVVVIAVLVVIINLLVDISYGWLNPKARLA